MGSDAYIRRAVRPIPWASLLLTPMHRIVRLCLSICVFALPNAVAAQPVYEAGDFQAVYTQPHTHTSYGIGTVDGLAAFTDLTGGPHVFDLTGTPLVSGAVQTVTPVSCAPTVPGCGQAALGAASVVLRARQQEEVYLFYDLDDAGLFHRGSAGEGRDASSGSLHEGALTVEGADRVFAFPLRVAEVWTSDFATHLRTDELLLELNRVRTVREVAAWGTLKTDVGSADVLVVHETRITTTLVEGIALEDTAHVYRFVSPRLRATVDVGAEGGVESATLERFESIATHVDEPGPLHQVAALHPPQPNPAREAVAISFTMDAAGPVTLDLFDVLGRHVSRLEGGVLPAGTHTRQWDAPAPAGLYYARLQVGTLVLSRAITRVE